MKSDSRKRLSELILDELTNKMKSDENLRLKLEPFANLPVEKVANAILQQLEYVLSSELKDLIIKMIEQEIAAEDETVATATAGSISSRTVLEAVEQAPAQPGVETRTSEEIDAATSTESIMERYAVKDHFPSELMDIELKPDDWFYMFGFCYPPDSTGKGYPSRKLSIKGIDDSNNIFLLDYGDVRLFMSKLNKDDYAPDKSGKPTLTPVKVAEYKYKHQNILNVLRSEEVILPLPFWTVIQGRESIVAKIDEKYVELLKALIDAHDAIDCDVEVYVFDQHLIELPFITDASKDRIQTRETRHQVRKGRDVKMMEKLLFKEKSLAQEIHSQLLLHSTKSKIDFMIRLDNAFMDDWKSILSARYTIGKDKRKNFYRNINSIQHDYNEYELMIKVTSPNVRIVFG